MAIFGYARVSTEQQSLAMQLDALSTVCDKVFQEKQSGAKRERPELQKVLKVLTAGDTLAVYKLDRLGRSLKDLIDIVDELQQKQIAFRSLNENIDTSTAMGKCFFHIIAAISQMEREQMLERTMAGLEAARKQGKFGGRPDKFTSAQIRHAMELDLQGKPRTEIAKLLGMSRATLYRLLKVDGAA